MDAHVTDGEIAEPSSPTDDAIRFLTGIAKKAHGPFLTDLMKDLIRLREGEMSSEEETALLQKIPLVMPTFSAAEPRLNEEQRRETKQAYKILKEALEEEFFPDLTIPPLKWQKEQLKNLYADRQLSNWQHTLFEETKAENRHFIKDWQQRETRWDDRLETMQKNKEKEQRNR